MSCNECNETEILAYRVVRTESQKNSLPCSERINGMIVTVVGPDLSYKQYMLQGGDPCVNTHWKEMFNKNTLASSVGHYTVEEPITQVIENIYLNERFPESLEGFKVTFLDLKTTFMKISGDRWVITNSIL